MTANPSADWRRHAACRGSDPNLWIPEGRGEGHLGYAITRPICNTCPVRQDCLDFAVTHNEEFGMWGGLTREERQDYKRNSSAA